MPDCMFQMTSSRCSGPNCRSIAGIDNELCMSQGLLIGYVLLNWVETVIFPTQVANFVECYMPAYKAYLPGLYAKGPTTAKAGRLLMLEIDEHRGLVPEQPPCPL